MRLCKHSRHKVIDWIIDPKWSTGEILISVDAIDPNTEHYIIKFKSASAEKRYGWFYMSGKMIRRHKTQKNGSGSVYVVPLAKREEFTPVTDCSHEVF